MKKRISMIMVICLLLSLTACGVNSGTNSNTEPSQPNPRPKHRPPNLRKIRVFLPMILLKDLTLRQNRQKKPLKRWLCISPPPAIQRPLRKKSLG